MRRRFCDYRFRMEMVLAVLLVMLLASARPAMALNGGASPGRFPDLDQQGTELLYEFSQILKDIEKGTDESFMKALDVSSALADATGRLDAGEEEFRNAAREKAEDLGRELVRKVNKCSRSRIVRVKKTDESWLALARMDFGDSGFEYLDFELAAALDGRLRIVDVVNYYTGLNLVETLRTAAIPYLKEESSYKLFFGDNDGAASQTAEFFRDAGDGREEKAVADWRALPEEISARKEVLATALAAASTAGLSKAYLEILKRAVDSHRDDPSMAWVAVDCGFLADDPQAALKGLDRMEGVAGQDAFITAVKSEARSVAGQGDAAAALAERAVKQEPEMEEGHWALFMAYAAQGKFEKAVEKGKFLESEFGYRLEPDLLRRTDVFFRLTASPEYSKWRDALEER